MNTFIKKSIVWILIVAILFSFSACRKSPVLEQVIYTDNEQVDQNSQKNKNEKDNEEQNQDIYSQKEDKSDTKRDYDNLKPLKGNQKNNKKAADEVYDSNSSSQNTATNTETKNTPSSENGKTNEGTQENPTVKKTKDFVYKEIVGSKGERIDVPTDVNTVSAVGDAAVISQMLGGVLNNKSRIVASSESFSQNEVAHTVFSDEYIAGIETLWEGKGKTPLSSDNFAKLIELFPDVCFVISGDMTFTEEQLKTLSEEYKICVVTLPKLNNPDNIKTAIRIVGEVLGDKTSSGGTNAESIASKYISWYERTISSVESKNKRFSFDNVDYSYDSYENYRVKKYGNPNQDGFFTLFISDWDTGATYKISSEHSVAVEGTGVAVAASGYSTTPTSYYLSLGGVCNTAAAYSDIYRLKNWYVCPLYSPSKLPNIIGSIGILDRGISTYLTSANKTSPYLGSEKFPALIVADNSIKENILAQKNMSGNSFWKVYGYASNGQASCSNGFVDASNQLIYSGISGDYDIFVIPNGVGDWSSGSPESVLLSVWSCQKYYNLFSENEVKNYIKDFYSEFYRYELSDSETEEILRGR